MAARDGTIQLRSRDGAVFGRLTGHTGPVGGLAFAPDGIHLASSADDATRWSSSSRDPEAPAADWLCYPVQKWERASERAYAGRPEGRAT